jgi:hypothetical protein
MKYVIHSQSERGFWNNVDGWVYSINDATLFDRQEGQLPVSMGHDAEWLVHTYDENSTDDLPYYNDLADRELALQQEAWEQITGNQHQ